MAKFYIQSGDTRFVVNAADAEGAALWVMNQTINRFLPIDQIDDRLLDTGTLECLVYGMDYLDSELLVSEVGFGRSEVAVFQTEQLFEKWCQLLFAMNSLLDQLD